jgi:hypothetical protein
MIDHDAMNRRPPPQKLAPAEVESLTGHSVEKPEPWMLDGTIQFHYRCKDGRNLMYCRWRDDDGDWFYLDSVLLERDSFKRESPLTGMDLLRERDDERLRRQSAAAANADAPNS